MQLNITSLLDTDMFPFAHSRAEGGQNAGPETWQAALDGPRPILSTPEEFDAFRDFVQSSGGWTRKEIDAFSDEELQALCLQWIAGDVREAPALIEDVRLYEKEGKWWYDHAATPDMETGPFDSRTEAYRAAADEHRGYNQTPRADSLEDIDWSEYEEDARAGRISSRLYRADDGHVYFELGM